MPKFIIVHDHAEDGEERLFNLAWVEEVRPGACGRADIYFAYKVDGYCEQDYILAQETYEEVKQMILGDEKHAD